ncbi:hypothetical protein [Kitasatospora phosalacinea]|uniref:hypothetical protein n=1 Tax=Kitasatospora phosalacinea TaxID=2065 RepID=UPI0033182AC8
MPGAADPLGVHHEQRAALGLVQVAAAFDVVGLSAVGGPVVGGPRVGARGSAAVPTAPP